MILLFIVISITSNADLVNSQSYCLPEWSHHGARGQDKWCCLVTSQCCDKLQSPIDIDTRNATRIKECMETEPLRRCIIPTSTYYNNGHSAEMQVNLPHDNRSPRLGDYIFNRVVYRFGKNSSYGSEHTLNGLRFPMEMQLIFKHRRYRTLQEAKMHPWGVRIVVVFVALSPVPDKTWLFVDLTKRNFQLPAYKGEKLCFQNRYYTGQLLPDRMNYFYEYNGSLTEPPCTQPIQYTVLHNPKYITEQQLQVFRQMKSHRRNDWCPTGENCEIADNWRKLQCRNRRPFKWGKDCKVAEYERL